MSKTNSNNTFINHYPAGMIHFNTATDEDGNERQFANVSFNCPESKSGYGTFSISMGKLLPATRKDGTVVNGRYSILLGDADKTRKVSVATNNPKDRSKRKYASVLLTNAQIAEYVDTARVKYKEAHVASA